MMNNLTINKYIKYTPYKISLLKTCIIKEEFIGLKLKNLKIQVLQNHFNKAFLQF
jgi:hypothetical protein